MNGHGARSPDRAAPQRPLSLQIDSLVVDGLALSPAQTAQMRLALENELQRLMTRASRGGHWQGAAVPSLQAPPLKASTTTPAAQLGRELARSLYAALGPSS